MRNVETRCISGNVGNYIRYLREQKGYSLRRMQELSGISSSYLNRIERGQRRAPSVPIITIIADCLNVPIANLLSISQDSYETDDAIELSELLLTSDFLINGQVVRGKAKELLIKTIEEITSVNWDANTKLRDSHTIVEMVDELKREI